MRWFRRGRRSREDADLHEASTVPPGSEHSSEAERERLAEIHDDEMRRERLLAEERRRAGSVTPSVLDPGRGFQAGFNRE